MPNPVPCPSCTTLNKPEASHCSRCGRKLQTADEARSGGLAVVLQQVTNGKVFTAEILDEAGKGPPSPKAPEPAVSVESIASKPAEIEDHSDVIAAAVDRIRAKAEAEGHRFKPYISSKIRKAPSPQAKEDAAKQFEVAVGRLRERRFEEAIEPLLKVIARDDEDRKAWILLAEAYLRIGRPYKSAVGYLRALELSPRDEQAWLGLGRVLRALDDLPVAAAVLDGAASVHPDHADVWIERGLVMESLQNFAEALRSFGKVLELRPNHPLALTKRKELESRIVQARSIHEMLGAGGATAVVTGAEAQPAVEERDEDILDEMKQALAAEIARERAAGPSASPAAKPVEPRPTAGTTRIRTFVESLDEILEGGIPKGHVVLIEGAPGTMKSSLVFSILLQNAVREGLHCLYLSLEERSSSLLKQMASLGLKVEVQKGSLVVLDPRTATDLLAEKADWVEGLRAGVRSIKEQRGLDVVAIDSLEALEVLAKFKDRRREMYRLFEWLRDLGTTSLVVTERPDWLVAGHVLQARWDEDFLADGVLHLRMHMVSDLDAQRRLRVVKMRGTKHETGYFAMVLDDGRFRVTRAMSQ